MAQLDCLDILCNYFNKKVDYGGADVGITLLRPLLERFDPLGAFQSEFLERNHYPTGDDRVYIPDNAVIDAPGPVTFRQVEQALDLGGFAMIRLTQMFGALRHLDPQIKEMENPRFGLIVFLYAVIYAIQYRIMEYYRSLLQQIALREDAATIRESYVKINARLEKFPLLRLMKDAILGKNLDRYRITTGPQLRGNIFH
jgi:hypothetical protein